MEEKDKVQEVPEVKENKENKAVPKKKKPLWLRIVGIVLLVLVLIVAGVLFFIDSIVETGIRTGGSMILKTKVEVDSVRLKILRGTLDIKNLRVGNPEGSTKVYAFELPSFHIGLDIGSLSTDKIIVNDIEIIGMKVNYEPRFKGGSNLQVLIDHMEDPNKKPPPETVKKEDKETAEKAAAKTVVIKNLVVKSGEIDVTLVGQSVPLPLPPLTMTNIGEKNDVTMAQAVTVFMKELVMSVVKASGQAVDVVGGTLKDAGQGVSNAAGGILDNVKGLFGGKKEDEKK